MAERALGLEQIIQWIVSAPVLPWIFFFGKILFIFTLGFGVIAPVMIWVERRVAAFVQDRVGPNRVGPLGLLQSLADGIKLLLKEDLRPDEVRPFFFILAPALAAIPAAMAFAVVPFGPETTLGGLLSSPARLQIAPLNVGLLYVLAIGSLAVYSIALAGWASNNKFSVMGSLRASAQMISYELAMGMAVVAVILMSGSVDLYDIVKAQTNNWFILSIPGLIAFLIFVPAMFAETNRTPFDLPEAEAELVVGFHTEYSGMKFGLFFLAEYVNMTTLSAMCVLFFFGGWELLPFGITWESVGYNVDQYWFSWMLPFAWFAAKVAFFLFVFVWVRWTLPRFRYDQLMSLGWKTLVPIGIANIVLVAGLLSFGGGF